WIGYERHSIKSRETHANVQVRRNGTYSLHNFAQESRAILKIPAITAFASVCAEEFVAEVSMTMLDIDKVEAQRACHACGTMEIFIDRANLTIAEHWIVV